MAKGGQFERDLSRKLSLWWTNDKRDDVFWRSSQSGGRATVRRRKGKATSGSYGDLTAIDPIGHDLLDFFVIEAKKGYSKDTFHSLLDKQKKAIQQPWESWIQQAEESWEAAGSFAWIIVSERNARRAVVMMPEALVQVLKEQGCFESKPRPFFTMTVNVCFRYLESEKFIKTRNRKRKKVRRKVKTFSQVSRTRRVSVMLLDKFLECVKPSDVREIGKRI